METVNLKIQGMSCGGCAKHVGRALQVLPGVRVDDVDVGSARVTIDPQKTSRTALVQAVREAGYDCSMS